MRVCLGTSDAPRRQSCVLLYVLDKNKTGNSRTDGLDVAGFWECVLFETWPLKCDGNCWVRSAQCAVRRLTRSGTNGASMAPARATVLLVPTPILRIPVGYSSAVYTTMTPNDDVIPSLPIRNSRITAQFRSVGRKTNRTHTAHVSIAHISRLAFCYCDFCFILLTHNCYLTFWRRNYLFNFSISCIQGVPGGMCQTSGECSLC